jgi:mono/diheme cytochrome c family protein
MWTMPKAIVVGLFVGVLIAERVAAADIMTPLDRVSSAPKGQLKSPYPDFARVAEQGLSIYRSLDCGGCHGGGGGGGMAAPLTNEVWIFGDDDDTLLVYPASRNPPFRLPPAIGAF